MIQSTCYGTLFAGFHTADRIQMAGRLVRVEVKVNNNESVVTTLKNLNVASNRCLDTSGPKFSEIKTLVDSSQ